MLEGGTELVALVRLQREEGGDAPPIALRQASDRLRKVGSIALRPASRNYAEPAERRDLGGARFLLGAADAPP